MEDGNLILQNCSGNQLRGEEGKEDGVVPGKKEEREKSEEVQLLFKLPILFPVPSEGLPYSRKTDKKGPRHRRGGFLCGKRNTSFRVGRQSRKETGLKTVSGKRKSISCVQS